MAPSVFTFESTPYPSASFNISLSPFLLHFGHSTAPVTDPILSRMQLITRRATAEPQSHQVSLKEINKRAVRRDQTGIRAIGYSHTCRLLTVDANHRFILELYKSGRVLCAGRSTTKGGEREAG